MGTAVNLNDELVNVAKSHAAIESRSVTKQIEHWVKIGRIAEQNQELNYSAIREILLGMEDVKSGRVEKYIPGTL